MEQVLNIQIIVIKETIFGFKVKSTNINTVVLLRIIIVTSIIYLMTSSTVIIILIWIFSLCIEQAVFVLGLRYADQTRLVFGWQLMLNLMCLIDISWATNFRLVGYTTNCATSINSPESVKLIGLILLPQFECDVYLITRTLLGGKLHSLAGTLGISGEIGEVLICIF